MIALYAGQSQSLVRIHSLNLSFIEKHANLPHITVHDGRHTFAARTRQAGIPLEDIKDVLGHKDVSTTQVYVHISPEVKKRSMNQLENYIEEQIKKHSN